MSARLDQLYEEFCGPDAIWPVGETIDVRRLHDVVLGLVVEMRALESALGVPRDTATTEVRGVGSEVQILDPAQTRTPEESSRFSSEGPGSAPPTRVAGTAKESASPGPAPQGSGRGPRRSADSKKGVRPIQRTT